jgi:glucokinase
VVGVDLGGTNVRAAVIDEVSGEIISRSANVPSLALDGVTATSKQIASAVKEALSKKNLSPSLVRGIGMAVPGHVHPKEGKVLWAPNFKDQWRNVQIAKPLAKETGLPVFIGNDANLASLAEYKYGAGIGSTHLVMFTLVTGIGGGVIINGKLLTGCNGGAAEIGHIIVAGGNENVRGGNGAYGSLEGLSQRDAIIERTARKIALGRKTILAEGDYERHSLTPKKISDAALKGDQLAIEVIEETGYYLGLGVASCISIINPDICVIGGGIAQSGAILFDALKRSAKANSVYTLFKSCQIVPAKLGDNAGIIGGCALVSVELGN